MIRTRIERAAARLFALAVEPLRGYLEVANIIDGVAHALAVDTADERHAHFALDRLDEAEDSAVALGPKVIGAQAALRAHADKLSALRMRANEMIAAAALAQHEARVVLGEQEASA